MEKIEEELFPGQGKLVIKDGLMTTTIVDMELDPVKCKFHTEGCVEIDTKSINYIAFSIEDLDTLRKLIKQADKRLR